MELRLNNEEKRIIVEALSRYEPVGIDVEKNRKKLLNKVIKSMKKIKVSSAKAKGRNLQYWVCEKIADIFDMRFVQDDTFPIHSREMGLSGTDIIIREPIASKFPYDIECKACETISLPAWIEQARKNKKDDHDWLLIIKKQSIGTEPIICMECFTFFSLFKKSI